MSRYARRIVHLILRKLRFVEIVKGERALSHPPARGSYLGDTPKPLPEMAKPSLDSPIKDVVHRARWFLGPARPHIYRGLTGEWF